MDLKRIDPEDVACAFRDTHMIVDASYYLKRQPDTDQPCGCAFGALFMRQFGFGTGVWPWAVEQTGSEAYVEGVDEGFAGRGPEYFSEDRHRDEFSRALNSFKSEPAREHWRLGVIDGFRSRCAVDLIQERPELAPLFVKSGQKRARRKIIA